MLTATHKALIDTAVAALDTLVKTAPPESIADFTRDALDYYAQRIGISKKEMYRVASVCVGLADQPMDAVVVVGKRIG